MSLITFYDEFLLSIRNCCRNSSRSIMQLYEYKVKFQVTEENGSSIKNNLFFSHEKVWRQAGEFSET